MRDWRDILAGIAAPLQSFADPGQRLFWLALIGSLVLALFVFVMTRPRGRPIRGSDFLAFLFPRDVWLHPSALMDVRLMFAKAALRTVFVAPWAVSAYGLAVATASILNHHFGLADDSTWPSVWVTTVYTVVLFVAWDASRYLVHRLMHRIPSLWEFHKVHHSAEVLTPFTLYRTHPVESFLFTLRGTLVTGLVTGVFFYLFQGQAVEAQFLGVNALGFLFNAAGGNLRHSHIWLSYGRRLEHLLISPAQHQIHHSSDPRHFDRNFGTWLAIWDWVGNSLVVTDRHQQALRFGVGDDQQNHDPRSVTSALVGPVRTAIGRAAVTMTLKPAALVLTVATIVLIAVNAWGQSVTDSSVGAPVEQAAGPLTDSDPEPFIFVPDGTETGAEQVTGSASPAAPPAYDLRLDTISIIGRAADLPRIAGSAHVVGQSELERNESNDIHDVLGSTPGVYVRGEDGYGLRPNIGLRGANSDRSAKITLMEDGILIAPAPYAAPAAYYFPMPTRLVGVEVFKGAASTRYGPNTIGGAINLKTRPIPYEPEGEVDVSWGVNRTGKVHGHWGGTYDGLGGMVEAVHLRTRGFKDLDGGGTTGFEKYDTMAKLRYSSDPGNRLFQQIEFKTGFGVEEGGETYLGLTDADFAATPYRRYAASRRDQIRWWHSQGQARYFLARGDLFDVQATVYRNDFSRDWRKLNGFRGNADLKQVLAQPDDGRNAVLAGILRGDQDTATNDEVLLIGSNDRRFVAQGLAVLSHWRPTWGEIENEFEFGLRFHHDTIEREHTEEGYLMRGGQLVAEGTPEDTTTRNRGAVFATALHVHQQLTWRKLMLTPGVRVELIDRSFRNRLDGSGDGDLDAVVVPGGGASYQVIDPLTVFAGIHKGFSPVSPGQPDSVEPEESVNYEIGTRLVRGDLYAEAIGFFNDYRNLTGECTQSSGCDLRLLNQQFNGGQVNVAGIELLASQAINFAGGWGLRGDGAYTFTRSEFQTSFSSLNPQFGEVESGDRLPYVPIHQGSLSGLVVVDPVELGMNIAFVGPMRDRAGQGRIPEDERVDGHQVVDAVVRAHIRDRGVIYVTAGNLLDKVYPISRRPYGLRPGRPRHAELGTKISF